MRIQKKYLILLAIVVVVVLAVLIVIFNYDKIKNSILANLAAVSLSTSVSFSNSQIYHDAGSKVPTLPCTKHKCNSAFGYCNAACDGGYYPDNLTAQKLCQKKGYDTLVSFTTKNGFYSSCSDNYMWKWNGTKAEYVWACKKNSAINTIKCAKKTCTPNWQCGDWNTCANNQQTRTCTDLNSCGVTTGKPAVTQSCKDQINIGLIKTRVILVDFNDSNYKLYESVGSASSISYAINQLNAYIKENSFGQATLSVKTTGPYTLSSDEICSFGYQNQDIQLIKEAVEKSDAESPIDDYTTVIVVHPYPSDKCAQGMNNSAFSFRTISTKRGPVIVRGIHIMTTGEFTIFHEMGHELGTSVFISHIYSLLCYDKNNNLKIAGGNCDSSPWGDPYSPMGDVNNISHYNSLEKEKMGWLSPDKILTTNNGTYSLTPLESSGNGYKSIIIPLPNSAYHLYLEYRNPQLTLINSTYNYLKPRTGVIIHALKDGYNGQPYFIVTNPTDKTAPLEIGKEYFVYGDSISIKVNSIINDVAIVTIKNSNPSSTQCNDGMNNDPSMGIGIDGKDFSCLNDKGVYDLSHLSEFFPMAQCFDFIDNDKDGKIDISDPQCSDTEDNSESN